MQWEYFTFTGLNKAQLTNLGLEGWELVAVTHAHGIEATFYFKRPLRKEPA